MVAIAQQAFTLDPAPAELGLAFRVPQLALVRDGKSAPLDDLAQLDWVLDLSHYNAVPTPDDLAKLDALPKVVKTALDPGPQQGLGFAMVEETTETELTDWLCRNLESGNGLRDFVSGWLGALLAQPTYGLARAGEQKFLIRTMLERRLGELRKVAVKQAWQAALFGTEPRVGVGESCQFEFHPYGYAPARDYDGRFGPQDFRHHYYGRVGDFDSQEEYDCAAWLDRQAAGGRIIFWVRNLAKREGAFFLQKADGRFYPDFVCLLPDGRVLAVECQGGRPGVAAREDVVVGNQWEKLSDGLCAFVAVKGGDTDPVEMRL